MVLRISVFQLWWVTLACVLVLLNVCSGASLQYGDKCMPGDNSTMENQCNAKESLTCQNGTCLCSDMTQMSYDPALGLCVGLAGHKCVHHPTEAHLPLFRKTHCVAYASCENHTCTCWAAFYRDETSTCSRKRGYLQQCRSDDQCDGRKALICKDNLCTCDPKSTAWNPELERCVGLPGQSCANQYRECVENYKCKVGVCVCKFKEVGGKDGKMKCDPVQHRYSKVCGKSRGDCGSELSCINGKCRCPNPDYQVYDYEQRQCVSLVGGPCTVLTPSSPTLILEEAATSAEDPDSYYFDRLRKGQKEGNKKNNKNKPKKKQRFPIPLYQNTSTSTPYPSESGEGGAGAKVIPCIPYARCLPYGPLQTPLSADAVPEMGRCECDKGYIETKKGKCNLPYNAPCDTHSKNKKDICDESVPLYCVNNLCSCKNSLDLYEEETKRCKKSIGSLCWKDPSCVATARCIRYSPRLPGRCMCPPNSQPDATYSACVSLQPYDVVDPSGESGIQFDGGRTEEEEDEEFTRK